MHRALLISEIVHHICDFLPPDDDTKVQNKVALAALARTARALHEPAIGALWRVLGYKGMSNLLRCMPPDLWAYKADKFRYKEICFVRDIAPSDWDRLFYYARHVCKTEPRTTLTLPPETKKRFVDALLAQHPSITLFPNLGRITYNEDTDGRLPLNLLVRPGSKLKDIHFTITIKPELEENIGLLSIFMLMSRVRPPLERLEITACTDVEDLEPRECLFPFVSMIQALPRLTSLVLELPWTWFPGIIGHLSDLPRLKQLNIGWQGDFPEDDAEPPHSSFHWSPSPFPSLRCLEFHVSSLISFCMAMQSISPLRLAVPSLWLTSSNIISPDELESSLRTISNAFNPTTFKELRIDRGDFEGGFCDDPDAEIPGSFFEPLLAFTSLESLTVEGEYLCIGDAWLKNMADAWPDLKHLYIASIPNIDHLDDEEYVNCDSDRCLTVDGLSYIASSCQSLLTLGSRIDLRDTQYLQAHDGARDKLKYQNNQLRELIVVPLSSLGDVEDAVSILSALFPRLHTVSTPWFHDEWALKGTCIKIEALLRERAQKHNVLG